MSVVVRLFVCLCLHIWNRDLKWLVLFTLLTMKLLLLFCPAYTIYDSALWHRQILIVPCEKKENRPLSDPISVYYLWRGYFKINTQDTGMKYFANNYLL